jgi:hypothetical protein
MYNKHALFEGHGSFRVEQKRKSASKKDKETFYWFSSFLSALLLRFFCLFIYSVVQDFRTFSILGTDSATERRKKGVTELFEVSLVSFAPLILYLLVS